MDTKVQHQKTYKTLPKYIPLNDDELSQLKDLVDDAHRCRETIMNLKVDAEKFLGVHEPGIGNVQIALSLVSEFHANLQNRERIQMMQRESTTSDSEGSE